MASWNLDKAHSEIEFKVKHLMISNVKGQFQEFEVKINNGSEDLSKAQIDVEILTSSITTKNEPRDTHLKSNEFFNSATYPLVKFSTTQIEKLNDKDYNLVGDLTIKDVTQPTVLSAEFGGIAKDPAGNKKAGYTVTGKINRQDFGLTWNEALETGGVMVSEDVKFHADIQFVLK